jgi:hypothetical protein
MDGSVPRIAVVGILMVLLIGCAGAATIQVSVYELAKNATPVPYASVYVNTALAGKTGSNGTLTITLPVTGTYNIKVTKPGYEDWSGPVGVNSASVLSILSRKNVTITAHVFDADSLGPVANATVRVTGEDVDSSASTDATGIVTVPVPAQGTYQVDVSAPEYRSQIAKVDIGIAAIEYQYELFRYDRFSLVVRNDVGKPVEDAVVFIDNVRKGTTDSRGAFILDIPRGKTYLVKIQAPGYQDYSEMRFIGPNEAMITVAVAQAPHQAFVLVSGETGAPVANASVYIDGILKGSTNQFGRYTLSNLLEGNYQIEIRRQGYLTVKRPIVISALSEDIPIELLFPKANLTIFVEDIEHRAIPGVQLSLNGADAGITDEKGVFETAIKTEIMYNITAVKEKYQNITVPKEIAIGNTSSTVTIVMEKSTDLLPILVPTAIVIVAAVIVGVILVITRRHMRKGSRKGKGL